MYQKLIPSVNLLPRFGNVGVSVSVITRTNRHLRLLAVSTEMFNHLASSSNILSTISDTRTSNMFYNGLK